MDLVSSAYDVAESIRINEPPENKRRKVNWTRLITKFTKSILSSAFSASAPCESSRSSISYDRFCGLLCARSLLAKNALKFVAVETLYDRPDPNWNAEFRC